MLFLIHFGGVLDFQRFDCPPRFRLIQILGDSEGPFPDARGAEQVLQLRFDDVHDTSPGLVPADVGTFLASDAALVEKEMAPGARELVRLFGISHARRIVQFAQEAHDEAEDMELVVHCLGGVSRSAAVAMVLGFLCRVPVACIAAVGRTITPNPRVTRLMADAMGDVSQA